MTDETEKINVYGARVHNLKNIDVEIPRNSLTVITGLSGSGKSSLAFDTLFAEGQRRYIETFSAYARNFLGGMERPDVDKITGLSPVISIEQKTTNKNPRSTVGTTTEIYDYLRLLFARAGTAYSYLSGEKMVKYTEEQIIDLILRDYAGRRIMLLAPLVRTRKGHYKELFEQVRKKGYLYVRVDGEVPEVTHGMKLDRYKNHDIEVVVDKLVVSGKDDKRLAQSVATAMTQGDGLIMARDAGAEIVSGGGAIALALDMGPTRLFEPYGVYLYFDQNGERFMDESVYWFERTRILMENDMTSYYMLIDGKTQNDGLAAAVEQGTAFTADTLEELAEQIGVPAEALVNTVNTYNGYCAAGADEAFGKPAHKEGKMLPRAAGGGGNVGTELEDVAYDLLNPYDTPPYSAIKVTLNSSSGTFGGPRVNVDGQVRRADNSVIVGLYAAGEVANGELFYKEYPCSGSATQLYSTMGRFAGRAAAAEAAAR